MTSLSGSHYSVNKNVMFKAAMLRSDLCDYSDTYIFVKEIINLVHRKVLHLKIILHLDHAYEKLTTH